MPVWSVDELLIVASMLSVLPEAVKDRFQKWGGIPRYIFSSQQETLEVGLKSAIYRSNQAQMLSYLSSAEFAEVSSISHSKSM